MMMKMKNRIMVEVLKFLAAILSAAITALTTTSCMGMGPWKFFL